MVHQNITIRAHMAWWLKPYVFALICFAYLTLMEPDWERLKATIRRACRFSVADG